MSMIRCVFTFVKMSMEPAPFAGTMAAFPLISFVFESSTRPPEAARFRSDTPSENRYPLPLDYGEVERVRSADRNAGAGTTGNGEGA